mmetsp:Transcript_107639/g.278675  ORF Transcript_107639/g.278675 Transcript_107639/m.278675 type:complete len:664 (+) Transcript_107639:99-2090(+)
MSPPAAASACTVEELHKELVRFAKESLRVELTQLRGEVRADLREELQPLLLCGSPSPTGDPPRFLDDVGLGRQPPIESLPNVVPFSPAEQESINGNRQAESLLPAVSRSSSKKSGRGRSAIQSRTTHLRNIADMAPNSAAYPEVGVESSSVPTDRPYSMSAAERAAIKPHRPAGKDKVGQTRDCNKGNALVRNAWVEPTQPLSDSDEIFDNPVRPPRVTSKRSLTRENLYSRLCTFVTGPQFDYISGTFVVLNAASLGVQTDWEARHVTTTDTPSVFRGIELTFCVLFTVELVLRAIVHGRNFFARKHLFWHAFDSFLVISQLVEECMVFVVEVGLVASSKGSSMTSNFSILRIMRILRLIRVMRLVRILRLIGELRTLVMSILGSLRSLIWAVVLLFMMMYVMGVYLTQVVLDARIDSGKSDVALTPLVDYFGSLGDTILSVYMAVTGGVDWGDILTPLKTQISVWLAPFFMFYIAFALLCMLNVITGVFVESALLTAKKDKDSYLVHSVRCLFSEHDVDNNGTISECEFMVAIESQEMQAILTQLDMRVADASALFQVLDLDGNGSISVEEFIAGCTQLAGHAKALELAILVRENERQHRYFTNHARRVEAYLEWIAKRWERALESASTSCLPLKSMEYARPIATPPSMSFFDLTGEIDEV